MQKEKNISSKISTRKVTILRNKAGLKNVLCIVPCSCLCESYQQHSVLFSPCGKTCR